ncbi:MAG: hypothetical protein R2777_10215 [Chitinophagales bacterium]
MKNFALENKPFPSVIVTEYVPKPKPETLLIPVDVPELKLKVYPLVPPFTVAVAVPLFCPQAAGEVDTAIL